MMSLMMRRSLEVLESLLGGELEARQALLVLPDYGAALAGPPADIRNSGNFDLWVIWEAAVIGHLPPVSAPVTNKYDHTHSLLGICPFKLTLAPVGKYLGSHVTCFKLKSTNILSSLLRALTINRAWNKQQSALWLGGASQTYEHLDKWASLDLELEWTTSWSYKYFTPLWTWRLE